ncbi:YceI family protein [Massilia endophytica]|uniref:YceI family protein n=1 Tax=Massilia endophytica TaxID=2899220 RepID=UPI001E65C66E|nr:YceI family protein [Massilia endophytica]UGQ49010.1 YceI family protein [Massilia endophytica]
MKKIYGCILVPVLLAACSQPAPGPAALHVQAAPASPAAALPRLHGEVLRIDPAASLITIVVRRGGRFALLGHDHVLAARAIEGEIMPGSGRAALRFRLDQLTVDEAALRSAAGLASQPSADAVAGTRDNMLRKVVEAERYPWVAVAVEAAAPGMVNADISLHGQTRRYAVPAAIGAGSGGMAVSGAFVLKQSDFGIVPFSVLGGALQVQDAMELRFDLRAR